jgi:hypothetical protein
VQKLNLPEYSFRLREVDSKKQIFDEVRKRFVSLSPEEWVRQNFLKYLVDEKKYPQSLISVEAGLNLFKRKKRTDIVVHDNQGKPLLLVECKAPEISIDQKVFDQILRYDMALNVNFMILTNGLVHYCCRIDYRHQSYKFLKEIPEYLDLK